MTNRYAFLSILLMLSLGLSAQVPDSWTQKADFPGTGRTSAVSFTIKGYGFVGTGEDSSLNLLKDFWRYDPTGNVWTRLADFGGTARKGAVGFGIDTIGYIGTGLDSTHLLYDFWEYDESQNSWTITQYLGSTSPAAGRRDATSISTSTNAYVLCGYDGSPGFQKETWKFDPLADTMWLRVKNLANVSDQVYFGRRWATGFSIDSLLYFGTGYNFSQDLKSDFWKYNPTSDSWTQLADFGGGMRSNAFAFSMYGKGYIGCGNGGNFHNDLWRYDPFTNSWQRVSDYGGVPIINGISFSLANRGYAGLGVDTLHNFHTDFWEYTPDSTTQVQELAQDITLNISPNPASLYIRLELEQKQNTSEEMLFSLFDCSGKKMIVKTLSQGTELINTSGFCPGIYYYSLQKGPALLSSGKLMIL